MSSSNFSGSSYLDRIRIATPIFVESIVTKLLENYNLDITNYGGNKIALDIDHVCYRTETIEEYKAIQHEFKDNPGKIKLLVESMIGGRPISVYEFLDPLSISIPIFEKIAHKEDNNVTLIHNDDIDVNKRVREYRKTIRCLELPSPKLDRNGNAKYRSGLEHMEVVIAPAYTSDNCSKGERKYATCVDTVELSLFKETHNNIQFDSRAFQKEINADLSLSFPREEMMLNLEGEITKEQRENFGEILEDITKDDISVKFHQMSLYEVVQFELNQSNSQSVPQDHFKKK